jgi:hypothetical protein
MSDERSEYEQVYDPEGPHERTEAEIEAEKRAEDRRMLLIRLLSDQDIRQWLWEVVIDAGHAFETRMGSVGGYAHDPIGTWLMAGEQKLAWWIWEQLDAASPDLASLMRREHR